MFSTELSPVVAAFLDLKNSPESHDDTSDYSDSFQSDSHVCYHMYTTHVKMHSNVFVLNFIDC